MKVHICILNTLLNFLLKQLWLGAKIHPEYEADARRRPNWYSKTPQYRDFNLTYKQVVYAYDGMEAIDLK